MGKKIINDRLEIIKINEALLQILGYAEHEMLGKLITDFAHPDFAAHWKQLQHQLWTTALPSFNFDTCLIKKDGSTVWVHVTTIQIADNGEMLGYTIIEDISVRKELERAKDLVDQQARRQQIVETTLNTQEKERIRIAESLHNGLGQLLYAVKLNLSLLATNRTTDEAAFNQALKYTENLLTQCIQECRGIAHDLMPAMLEEHGLKEAVTDICRQLSGEVAFECNINGLDKRLDKFLEVGIYRIIQEVVMNIVKHAGARHAMVSITELETALNIRITDDGKGFDEAGSQKKGIGLQTIRYKVKQLSGTLQTDSVIGKGTSFNITIPKRVD